MLHLFQLLEGASVAQLLKPELVNVNLRGGGAVAQWYCTCLACVRYRVRIPSMAKFRAAIYSLSDKIINRCPNTPISMTHSLICDELKDRGIPPKVVPL